MSFEWSDYLALARNLYQQGIIHSSKEAELRSAISRAYYAAFCKARNHLRDKEKIVLSEGGQVHAEVQNAFLSSSDRRRKEIGQNLNRLRLFRNQADYRDKLSRLDKTTATSLELADDIISEIRKL
ncbi:MAG: hypothetical protein JOZ71_08560 [Ktedonobacteraceae bacterium]|nr:hypothetical protein [Ktedonobacteraceae bacterium]